MSTATNSSSSRPGTRLPRPVSTAMLSRATSSLSLNPASTRSTRDPSPGSSSKSLGIPLTITVSKQVSRLPTTSNRSTAALRPSASTTSTHLALRPSRLQPKTTASIASSPAEQPRKPIGPRKVSSTHFKENFFAPPPGVPPVIGRGDKGGLMKKKSQISLLRPIPSSTRLRPGYSGGDSVKVGNKARPVIVATPEKTSVRGVGQPRSGGLPQDDNPLVPQPPSSRPLPAPLPSLQSRPLLPNPQIQAQPSAIPAHLLSSPWKGPRISIEQIKDTEFSFTEEDSIDLGSESLGLSKNAVLSGSGIIGKSTMSGGSPKREIGSSRPRLVLSDGGNRTNEPGPSGLARQCDMGDLIKEKEKEIQMLRMELSVERQKLGRVGREAADKIQAAREAYEADKLSIEEEVKGIKREMVRQKYEVVERSAQELLVDIEAQKQMIKSLKGMLIA